MNMPMLSTWLLAGRLLPVENWPCFAALTMTSLSAAVPPGRCNQYVSAQALGSFAVP